MRARGSLISVVLNVQEPELSRQIWESHVNGNLVLGCKVQGIMDGDAFEDRDLIEKYETYVRGHVDDFSDSNFKSFEEFVDELEEKKKKMDEPAPPAIH